MSDFAVSLGVYSSPPFVLPGWLTKEARVQLDREVPVCGPDDQRAVGVSD